MQRLAFEPRPDLILLDIMMPELDGFETCRRIRRDPRIADIPVIIQTALASNQDRVQCFQAGATDVVSKPLNLQELVARMRVHLENRLMIETLTGFHDRLDRELRLARRMQAKLMPDRSELVKALEMNGVQLDAVYQPCDEIGGDLWACNQIDDHTLALMTADCSSHGLIAAINAFRLHTIVSQIDADPRHPGAWMGALNETMVEEFGTDNLATAFYGVIDTKSGQLTYASAGAPPPLVYRRESDKVAITQLDAKGMMLGILEDYEYAERVVAFPRGTGVLLYSDAVTESVDMFGYQIGVEDLEKWGREAVSQTLLSPLSVIRSNFEERVVPPWHDDLTMVWVGVE
jgi:sigma-B regulation protein RsbU (phosphoserine phosphatase)